MYDGFVSYSHAADGLLAPRLQAELQRFAKPWWQRRALRIFRDEASLSANPHLWESIVEAMAESEWLVLLLSPEAAESEWVSREIEYWKSNRDVSRILPVVTDGSFAWRDGEVSGSAVSPALRGVFAGEPRWVDMRFAHSDEHLDLKNPEFLDAVADIASALHGIPKDELASEEVKQHRRTVRTIWSAGVALVGLTIAAAVFGIQANQLRGVAEHSAGLAAERADAERAAREEADALRDQAREEAERANRNAAINEMRLFAARSAGLVDTDPELATLLALLAVTKAPDQVHEFEVHDDLRAAIAANRLVARFDAPGHLETSYNQGVISADGSTVYAVQHLDELGSRVVGIDVDSGEILDTYYEGDGALLVSASFDGSWLAIGLADEPLQVVVVNLSTAATVQTFDLKGCEEFPYAPHFSPDGRYLTYLDGTVGCTEDKAADWAVIHDTSTWESMRIDRDATYEWVQFANGSRTALVLSCPDESFLCRLELLDFPSLATVATFSGFLPSLDHLGKTLVYTYSEAEAAFGSTRIHDLVSGNIVSVPELREGEWVPYEERPVWSYEMSPDGSRVAIVLKPVGTFTKQTIDIVDTADGSPIARLPEFPVELGGHGVYGVSWTGDGSRLLTSHSTGLLLWDTSQINDREFLSEVADPVELALETLTRGFSQSECTQFAISPCLSLEELRAELLDSN